MEYGLVKILKGKYKDKIVYYDDDDDYGNAILLFGDLLHNYKEITLPFDSITDKITFNDLEKRKDYVEREIFNCNSASKRSSLLEELNLIDNELVIRMKETLFSDSTGKINVFLSHSSKDKEAVVNVAMDLEYYGINVWLDSKDIIPGESILTKISEGLNKCDFLLLFLSDNSVSSEWVKKEWEAVMWEEVNNKRIIVIPVLLNKCEIPKLLKTKKYIDFSEDYSYALDELLDAIKRHSEK